MKDVLEDLPVGHADFVHLSNILDWLTPAEASATLRSAHRAMKPGGRVLLRQLNSTLDGERLDSGLVWDTDWGRRLELADRSFFYPALHVGREG
jgi:S-adenosylmethionine-diacylglycerol 3-amino-3-carboxypropyl transferase